MDDDAVNSNIGYHHLKSMTSYITGDPSVTRTNIPNFEVKVMTRPNMVKNTFGAIEH